MFNQFQARRQDTIKVVVILDRDVYVYGTTGFTIISLSFFHYLNFFRKKCEIYLRVHLEEYNNGLVNPDHLCDSGCTTVDK